MKDTSQFDGDVSRTDDNGALREIFEVEEPIRVETEVVTGDILGEGRSTSNGDNDSVRSVLTFLVGSSVGLLGGVSRRNRESVLVDESSVSRNILDTVFLDIYGIENRQL